MRRKLYRFAALVLAPMIATGCPKDDTSNPEGDTDTDTDTDADTDTDSDADTDTTDYGVPSIRYLLSGTVTDAATGEGVPGIELDFQGVTTQSSKGGAWSFDTYEAGYCDDACVVDARDVDGEDNGVYEDAQVALDPTQTMGHSPDEGIYEQFDVAVPMNRLDSEDTATPVEE
jgi:hypothetical protein